MCCCCMYIYSLYVYLYLHYMCIWNSLNFHFSCYSVQILFYIEVVQLIKYETKVTNRPNGLQSTALHSLENDLPGLWPTAESVS